MTEEAARRATNTEGWFGGLGVVGRRHHRSGGGKLRDNRAVFKLKIWRINKPRDKFTKASIFV